MEEAALRAEAEKLILSQSQDELLSLLEQYAPDYDALGQTLGEKLLDGFARGAGDVAAWFEDFSARLAGAQAQMAALAPVSYTHLDVYKRQEQGTPGAQRARRRKPPGRGRRDRGGGVRTAGRAGMS